MCADRFYSRGPGILSGKREGMQSRKEFLQKSAAFLGAFFLPAHLMPEEDYDDITVPSSVKSVIFLNMAGGMSHVDTFDPKAGQSVFSGVATSISGIQFAETMKATAKEASRVSLIRSTWSEDGDHSFGQKLLHTGYRVPQAQAFPDIPSFGAIIAYAKKRKDKGPYFPSHITMGSRGGLTGRSGFLGVKYGAFQIGNLDNPVTHLKPAVGRIAEDRKGRRGKMLDMLNESFSKDTSSAQVDQWKQMYLAALDFANSERLDVFDISKEKPELRAKFGESSIGKSLLMAKRLAQAEVPFIELTVGGWDTHNDNAAKIKGITKDLDPALAALLGELGSSGLLKQTLVVLSSEFGRTPDVGTRDGRDHWPKVWTTLIAGGSIPQGAVIGESDPKGQKPAKRPVHVREIVATIYRASGVDPDAHPYNSMGRPFPLVPRGTEAVSELVGN